MKKIAFQLLISLVLSFLILPLAWIPESVTIKAKGTPTVFYPFYEYWQMAGIYLMAICSGFWIVEQSGKLYDNWKERNL